MIFKETVKYFTDVKTYLDDKYDKLSIASGNIFESLARTDPAAFNKEKLQAIRESENIVKEFNDYLIDIIDIVYADYENRYNNSITDNEKLIASYDTNTLIFEFIDNVIKFVDTEDIDFEKEGIKNENDKWKFAKKVILEYYFPESLTEEGCKKLIDLRISYNNLLVENLIKILENNYKALQISGGEARSLIAKLKDNEYEAIQKFQNLFRDYNRLKKFAFKGTNFDFRSIGGPCMFISDDISSYFSNSPAKRLSILFDYDAIVVAHGGYEPVSDVTSTNYNIDNGYNNIKKEIKRLQIYFKLQFNTTKDIYRKNACKRALTLIRYMNFPLNKYTDFFIKNFKDEAYYLDEELKYTNPKDTDKEWHDNVTKISILCYKFIANLKAKKNKPLFIKNGSSVDWSCQPLNTLKSNNLTNVIDVIRALKAEGFKNIYIGNCNPGDVRLPRDIENDKDFCVTIGHHSVYLEGVKDFYIDDNVIIEGKLTNSIKKFFIKLKQYTANIFSTIRSKANSINENVNEFIDKMRNGVDTKSKLKNKVDLNTIAFDSTGRAYSMHVQCDTINDIEDNFIEANNTIYAKINSIIDQNTIYISRLNNLEYKNSISENIIFNNIKFI